MRVLGIFLMILSVLLYIDMQLKRWFDEPNVHPWILVIIFVAGAMITYYDYRYNVLPSMTGKKTCPYCDQELWVDDGTGDYYCNRCDRTL